MPPPSNSAAPPGAAKGGRGDSLSHLAEAGFTLLEILAVLVIAGFIMLGLMGATRFGLAALEHQVRLSGRIEDLDATDRLIRQLIEQLEPNPRLSADDRIGGTATRFACVSRLPEGGARPLMRRANILLSAEPEGTGVRLVLVSRPHLHWLKPEPPSDRTVLVTGLASVAFSYWLVEPDGTGAWVDDWQRPGPPALVRLRLRFPDGSGRVWPDIVAAPHRDPAQS